MKKFWTSAQQRRPNIVGPTAWYQSTNFKYWPNSTASCTLTQKEKNWNFPTWVDTMLQLTVQSAYWSSRRKPCGESSCPVQIPWNTSPRVEWLFTDRTPQLWITFTPLHTRTDTIIARTAQTNSDHCISNFQRPINYSTYVLTTRVLAPRPIVLVSARPLTFVLVPSRQINPNAKSTRMLTRNRKLTVWTHARNRPAPKVEIEPHAD